MWETIKEAIKTNGGTARFLAIVLILLLAVMICSHGLGAAAPGLFTPIFRSLR